MGMLDGLVPGNDPRLKRLLRQRAEGDVRQASHMARDEGRASNARTAASTQARATDAGLNPALAQRMAGQQEQQANVAVQQQYARDRAREVEQAEKGLADLRAQRGAFLRQLVGKGMSTLGAMSSQLGVGGGAPGGQGGGPQGVSSAGGFLSGQGAGGGGGLGALGGLAGTAVGGPLGGMVGGQLGGMLGGGGGGGMGQTLGMVDSAMSGFPGGPGAAPAPAPGVGSGVAGLPQALVGLQGAGAPAQAGALQQGQAGSVMGQVGGIDPNGPPPADPNDFIAWMLAGGRL